MDSKRFGQHQPDEFRLTLERVGNDFIAKLAPVNQTLEAIHHCSPNPDWRELQRKLEKFQNPTADFARDFTELGKELGRLAFPTSIIEALGPSIRNQGVRIWIEPDASLRSFPWEAVWIDRGAQNIQGHLCLHPGVHLIRWAQTQAAPKQTKATSLRVLIAWANPSSREYPKLPGLDLEVQSVKKALSAPECRALDVLELPYATPAALLRSLEEFQPTILHFLGHGNVKPTGCVIALEGAQRGEVALVYGDELVRWIQSSPVQLAFLSGCNTGTAWMGQSIAESGGCSFVGMQAPIDDQTAGLFARAFYSTLAEGQSIEAAMHQGRSAIRGIRNEWAVPVLYQSTAADGRLMLTEDEDQRAASQPEHNISTDDRPFVGRVNERKELCDRILTKNQRLITVTGMGGMGKTRLSKQVALDVLPHFTDGVWMVECDSLESESDLIGAIGTALGTPASGRDPIETICRNIADRKTLLYLDCFETLVPLANCLERLIRGTSNLTLLVSSRIVLSVASEFEYSLDPMVVAKKPTQITDSVALFVEAAGHSITDFKVDAKNRAVVRDLCEVLEGVPLALILAAGRLRHLSLEEILTQVQAHPLDILKRKGSVKDRHANMQRVVDDSFRLLQDEEKDFIDRLSIFIGVFTADDAAEVLGDSIASMLDNLSMLKDNSLVQIQRKEGRTRYKLLDTVREYINRLPRNEEVLANRRECQLRHASLYCRLAEQIDAIYTEGRWLEATSMLWENLGNIRSATNFCVQEELNTEVARFSYALLPLYFDSSYYADFEKLCQPAYRVAHLLDDYKLKRRVYGLDGARAAIIKDKPRCIEIWNKRIEICQAAGDTEGVADTLIDLSWEYAELGQLDVAKDHLDRGLELARSIQNQNLAATCLVQIAGQAFERGETKVGLETLRQAETEIDYATGKQLIPFVLQYSALLYQQYGFDADAWRFAQSLLAMTLEGHRYQQVSWSLACLGELSEKAENFEFAAFCMVTATKLNREFTTKYEPRVRTGTTRLQKSHPEIMTRLIAEHRKTPWLSMVKTILKESSIRV